MRVFVTGVTGFLGRRTAEILSSQGFMITGLARDPSQTEDLKVLGVKIIAGDLSDTSILNQAFMSQDAVVHTAALSSPWGRYPDFYKANVIGTRNVAKACLNTGVQRLVHISTPSIYVDRRDRLGVRETDPLPLKPINDYAATKLLAEKEIDLAVAQGLNAVLLRPQGIFGPGDRAIMPRILRVAKRGVFPIIGDGKNQVDMTYVDNVVEATRLALIGASVPTGLRMNITNDEPVVNYELIDRILKGLGLSYCKKHLSFQKAYGAATVFEWIGRLSGREPIITKYGVCALSKTRTLNIDLAKNTLGYRPLVSVDEGVQRTLKWLS